MAKTLFPLILFLLPVSYSFAQGTSGKNATSPMKAPRPAEAKLPFDSSIIIYYKGPEKSPKTPLSNAATTESKKNDSMDRLGTKQGDQREPAETSKGSAQAPNKNALPGLSPITIFYPAYTRPAAFKAVASSSPRKEVKPQAATPSVNSAVEQERRGIRKTPSAGLLTNSFLPSGTSAPRQNAVSASEKIESAAGSKFKARSEPASLITKPNALSISAMMPRTFSQLPPEAPQIELNVLENMPAISKTAEPIAESDTSALETSNDHSVPSAAADKRPLNATPAALDWVDMNNTAVHMTMEANYSEAQALLEKSIATEPGAARSHRNLSIVFERTRQLDKALASARTAVKLAPDEPSMLQQLCPLELGIGEPSAAVVCFEKLETLSPLDSLSQTYYGTALFRAGKIAEALPVLEAAARSTPSIAEAQNAVGVVYFSTKRVDEAIAAFKNGIEIAPELYEIRFNLAVAELSRRNKAAALSQYNLIKSGDDKLASQLYKMLFGDKVLSVSDVARRKR